MSGNSTPFSRQPTVMKPKLYPYSDTYRTCSSITKGCGGVKNHFPLVAYDCKAAILRVQMWLTHSSDVVGLSRDYPKRWHIEEFFNANQALGWKRAGTQNLHIRYA